MRRPEYEPESQEPNADEAVPKSYESSGPELRHGYTLDSIDRLAYWAASRKLWHRGTEFSTRNEVAWSAMIEHLYASDQQPTVRELIDAGWRAIGRHAQSRVQFLGRSTDDPYAGTKPKFERYWRHVCAHAPSPEERIVERLALRQIWPCLRPVHREALMALAAHGDYARAAESLGEPYTTFKAQVSRARREFLELWHEGEKPSRPWVRDRRAGPGTDMHTITYFLRARRLRARSKTAVPAFGQDRQCETP
jgi:hypothetical protein